MKKGIVGKVSFACASVMLGMWLENNQKVVFAAENDANTQVTATTKNNQINTDKEETQDTTKVVIHYQGDNNKWVPYVWGKRPNGDGNQYKWDGEDQYGHYSTIILDKNYDDVGVLIKGKDNWNKDGQGNDRVVSVADSGKAEVWYKEGSDEAQKVTPKYTEANINLHYHSNEDVTKVNYWTDKDQTKQEIELSPDGVDKLGKIEIKDSDFSKIFVSPIDHDEIVREFTPLPGKDATDIYLVNGDETAYYTKSFALRQESLASASMENSKTINIEAGKSTTVEELKKKLQLPNNKVVKVEAIDPKDNQSKNFTVTVANDLDISKNNQIGINNNFKSIDIGNYIRSKEFDEKYYYGGSDLGAVYAPDQTQIKLWAPTATKVNLNLYNSVDNNAAKTQTIKMVRQDKGVWLGVIKKDLKGYAYDFDLTFGNGTKTHTNDPYSKAVTINGDRSVIENYNVIKPDNFNRMPEFSKPTDAIIYETSVRDFTSDPNSGITHKGKFLGMIESGRTPSGQITGLDYLKSLGITHVQLLPMFDFASVDETAKTPNYNWGYDPKNYNVPEGSYSTDPTDPTNRILEMKEMINGLHKAGLRVVMDVVYNHVFDASKQALDKTVPGYYFQYDAQNHTTNGTGCGNDVASERKMARKYIVDSVVYWAKNYNLDGFRFDLMGILDVETMNEIRQKLNQIDPSILVYGEGWDMRQTNHDLGAGQYNADKLKGIGFFSDDIRNAIKGAEFGGISPALVEGNGKEANYQKDAKLFIDGFLGGQNYGKDANHPYLEPSQTINYVACHDNRTLYDMLKALMPNESEANLIKRDKLATAMAMLAQGIPFVHAGQESLGTKGGNENSYNAPVEVNEINWKRVHDNQDVVNFFKELVNLRKNNDIFRQTSYDQINKKVKVVKAGEDGVFAFEYDTKDKQTYVIFNVNNQNAQLDGIDLKNGKKLLDSDGKVALENNTKLLPLSTLVVEKVSANPVKPDDKEKPTNPVKPDEQDDKPTIIEKNSQTNISQPIDDSTNVTTDAQTPTTVQLMDKLIGHNSYVYDHNGKIVFENGQRLLLKKGTTIKVYRDKTVTIFGKHYYRIGEDRFIKLANIGIKNVLVHNAFIYSNKAKRTKKLLRKNKKITILDDGQLHVIKGRHFYRIGKNQYVLA